MLGHRDPQRSLFDSSTQLGGDVIDKMGFYGRLAREGHRFFRDADFAALYCLDNGRPSAPPSLLSMATLLQHFDGVSDAEVVERCRYDLRWKAALGQELASVRAPFAKSTFQAFRARLTLYAAEGLLFEGSVRAAREAGLLPRKLCVALDSSPVRGRGAVKDTFNLLSDAIVAIIRAVAGKRGSRTEVVAAEAGLQRHVESKSIKGSEEVDWSDDKSVGEFLDGLLNDGAKAVALAKQAECGGAEVSLLEKIIGDDVDSGGDGGGGGNDAEPESESESEPEPEPEPALGAMDGGEWTAKPAPEGRGAGTAERQSEPEPAESGNAGEARNEGSEREAESGARIRRGTAKERTVSVHDPEMRHGRKSNSKRYEGHKGHVAVETGSGVITAVELDAPSVPESATVAGLLKQSERLTHSEIDSALGDCAYSGDEAQSEAATVGIELLTRMPGHRRGYFGPGDFEVSENGREARCPQGVDSARNSKSNGGIVHYWPKKACGNCPLREQCTKATRRTLRVAPGFHDRRAREQYANSSEGRQRLRKRVAVEHGIGRMKARGAGQSRYFGRAKTKMQWLMIAATVNYSLLFARRSTPSADGPRSPSKKRSALRLRGYRRATRPLSRHNRRTATAAAGHTVRPDEPLFGAGRKKWAFRPGL